MEILNYSAVSKNLFSNSSSNSVLGKARQAGKFNATGIKLVYIFVCLKISQMQTC